MHKYCRCRGGAGGGDGGVEPEQIISKCTPANNGCKRDLQICDWGL